MRGRATGIVVRVLAAAVGLLALATCAPLKGDEPAAGAPLPPDLASLVAPAALSAKAAAEVPRILERRCVVCHGCYDAPCQLKLSSPDGVARGAAKSDVYDTRRLTDAMPTRLGIDARAPAQWRSLGFHPVIAEKGSDPGASPMARLLALGRVQNLPSSGPLPPALGIDIDRPLSCPAPGEIEAHVAATPHGGMPYAMAPLPDDEFAALGAWLLSGERIDWGRVVVPPAIAREVAAWEAFLNRPDPRQRLVSRYLFEHLFLAHLHVEGDAPDRFFRLLRSRTPQGQPVDEIATRRPFDDPEGPFFYRISPIEETIVHKDHIVYEIGPRRMARFETLFLAHPWTAGEMPLWGVAAGANPFRTFAAIPAGSRYRFLLDDALFFVRSFIRGPVCHGQVATDVIEDRFWVAFLAPEADLSLIDPDLLAEGADFLKLPVETAGDTAFARIWPVLHDGHRAWLEYRDAAYAARGRYVAGFGLGGIWDGDGTNPQALLTVFRNQDNATVVPGFVGAEPETAWIIDYPIFERIYYDLVAGYDVFSSVEVQITTRLYMDHLRRESEDLFLSFLPVEDRAALHASWYRGALSELHASWTARREDDTRPTAVAYATDEPKRELLLALLDRGAGLWPLADPLNRCESAQCPTGSMAGDVLSGLTSRTELWVRHLPDLTLLHVMSEDGSEEVFTLFHDRAHENVALIFDERSRLEPERDVLTAIRGQVGSYPNFFLEVPPGGLEAFAAALTSIRGEAGWLDFVGRYGIRRTSPRFWDVADAMQDNLVRQAPIEAGILDLNRYHDPRPAASR